MRIPASNGGSRRVCSSSFAFGDLLDLSGTKLGFLYATRRARTLFRTSPKEVRAALKG
jgi:hypothetical protein